MSKSKIKKFFERNDNKYPITFEIQDGELMVNATQMGKAFGETKKPQRFLRNRQTMLFINELRKEFDNGSNLNRTYIKEPVVVIGDKARPSLRGTWMHEKLALKYASWISPKFELWVYNNITELIKNGKVELPVPELMQMQQHLDPQTQRDNTKEVAKKIYLSTKGDVKQIPLYHHKNLMKVMGCGKKDILYIGKSKGLSRSITSKGAKEVIRTLYPEKACVLSVADNIMAATPRFGIDDHDYVLEAAMDGEKMFKKFIKMGVIPQEVRKWNTLFGTIKVIMILI